MGAGRRHRQGIDDDAPPAPATIGGKAVVDDVIASAMTLREHRCEGERGHLRGATNVGRRAPPQERRDAEFVDVDELTAQREEALGVEWFRPAQSGLPVRHGRELRPCCRSCCVARRRRRLRLRRVPGPLPSATTPMAYSRGADTSAATAYGAGVGSDGLWRRWRRRRSRRRS